MSRLFLFLTIALQFAPLCFATDSSQVDSIAAQVQLPRIQEPIPPYPYLEEEVTFTNPADGVVLSGTLTLPSTQGPFPVVILLHGSAPLDRNQSICGHKSFLVLSDYLTRQGIAVLRFDKRGAGESTGNYDTATIEDFAGDALAGVKYLKTRKEISSNQIGLIGFSEGGMTAPLATSKSSDVAYIVLMAGAAVNWKEMMFVQLELILRVDGVPEETISTSRDVLGNIFTVLEAQSDRELAAIQLREMLTNSLNNLTASQRETFESYYGSVENQVKLFNAVWFRYYLTYDPFQTLKQIKIPVLALNGELDVTVSSKQNLSAIDKALFQADNQDYTIMELPRVNHMFQTCDSGSIRNYSLIEETLSPAALNIVSEWILKRTGKQS